MTKWIVRIVLILLAVMIVFSCVYSVFAAEFEGDTADATSVLLMDASTGTILYEKDIDVKLAPASTTKLMTAILAMEHLSLEQEITVPAEAQTSGTLMGIKPGNVVTVETLLYGLMLCSGNDAAVTFAIQIAGSQEAFAAMMNAKAKEIGMEDSHFVTASGLDAEGHTVTVRDMARLARVFLSNEFLRKVAATTKFTGTTVDKTISFPMENTNRLLHTPTMETGEDVIDMPDFTYEFATGLKTGTTTTAKGCLVASATKDGTTLIALVFGDKSQNYISRWKIARALFEFGFEQYQNVLLEDFADEDLLIDVIGGAVVGGEPMKLKCVPMSIDGAKSITLSKDVDMSAIEYVVHADEGITAPVEPGQVVGTVELSYNGTRLFYGNLAASDGIMTEEDYKKLTGKPLESAEGNGNGLRVAGLTISPFILLGAVVILLIIVVVVIMRIRNRRNRKKMTKKAQKNTMHPSRKKEELQKRVYRASPNAPQRKRRR